MREGGAATASGTARVAALDGLRGLAALAVLWGHAEGALRKPFAVAVWLHTGPLAVVLNGIGGIHVFFVLSGYCLTASARRGRGLVALAQYGVRRVFRIHLPFAFGLLVAWLATATTVGTPDVPGLSPWIERLRNVHLDVPHLLYSLRFPGEAFLQMPVGWTLQVEMIFSLLLPFGVWLAGATHGAVLVALGVAALLAEPALHHAQPYALDFALGIALHLERVRLAAAFARLPALLRGVLPLLGIALLTTPRWLRIDRPYPDESAVALLVFGGGAAVLVACAVHVGALRRMLAWRPLAELGRVSYSVYLLHLTVILLAAGLVEERVGVGGALAFTAGVTAVTLALAPLSFAWVERPAIRLGNRVCEGLARLAGSPARPSHRADA